MTNEEAKIEEVEVSLPSVDMDTVSDTVSPAQMGELLGPAKAVNKPDISRLPSAVDPSGRALFKPGDKIVVERYASCLPGHPYLDTKTYRVLGVDQSSGGVRLYEEVLNQYASTNFKEAIAVGYVFKFASGNVVSTKKKRGRPRKNPVIDVVEKATETTAVVGEKRGRGRPKGVKNRPKDVIKEEKKAKAALRAAKKTAAKKKTKKAG